MGTKSAWTPERRAKQREIIRQSKPWEKSTGPRTPEGKAVSSKNALLPENIRVARDLREELRLSHLFVLGRKRSASFGRQKKRTLP
jgi:hypothetical protein